MTISIVWEEVIGKQVKSIDEKEIGKIKNIFDDHIEIENGVISKDHYFIPKSFAERYEDDNVIISLTEDEIKEKFKKSS